MGKLLSDRAKIIPLLGVVVLIAVGAALVIVLTPGSTGGGASARSTSTARAGGAGAGGAGGGGAGVPVKVTIKNYVFQPASLTVPAGTTVTWINEDSTNHTATGDGNFSAGSSFDTGTIGDRQTKTAKLTKLGTYPYHCSFHAFMHGTIIVK